MIDIINELERLSGELEYLFMLSLCFFLGCVIGSYLRNLLEESECLEENE